MHYITGSFPSDKILHLYHAHTGLENKKFLFKLYTLITAQRFRPVVSSMTIAEILHHLLGHRHTRRIQNFNTVSQKGVVQDLT